MKQTNPNRPSDKAGMILILIFFLFGLLVLIPLFPPFGLFWCAILASSMGSLRKKSKQQREDLPPRSRSNRREHGHDPVGYSYDKCAMDKRLEQLEVLRSAGLLDPSEYQARRQEILNLR